MNYEEDFKDYYVGELVFTKSWNDNSHLERNRIILNGAINLSFSSVNPNAPDFDNYKCDRVFTIFLKKAGEYFCLHDKKWYPLNQYQDYCQNLIRLMDIIPVIGYKIPSSLTPNQALHLFNHLFKRGLFLNQEKLFDKKKRLLMDNIYVGSLYLHEGYSDLHEQRNHYQYQNLARRLILEKSDASLIGIDAFDKFDENGLISEIHNYGYYDTLFLEYARKGMYNLHNFEFYRKEKFKEMDMTQKVSACDDLVSFKESLEKHGIQCKDRELSVPDALKLYRKMKRK